MFGIFSFLSEITQTTPAGPPGDLGQLSFLVGGTWVTQVEGSEGTVTVEESCTWGPGKICILTSVTSTQNGQTIPSGNGLFFWNPQTSSLMCTSAVAGSVSYFHQARPAKPLPTPAFPTWVFAGMVTPTSGAGVPTTVTMALMNPNEMSISSEIRVQGKVTALPPKSYRRQPT